ncbi:MAG: PorT family protein [Muribaculaceae bacterium]|nr:PorT family protein [Muribaculaceae bacterium]
MKKILVIIAFVATAFSVFAQGYNSWGIRAAFDINMPGKVGLGGNDGKLDDFRMGYGGSIGAAYSYWLSDSFFFEPALSLFYDSYSYNDNIVIGESMEVSKGPSLYKLGLRLPLVIGYSYYLVDSFPMRVFTGPELSYAFAGKVNVKDKALQDLIETDLFGKNGFMKPLDCAWKIGLGIDFDLATVCVEAALGLTDVYKGPFTLRENRVTISLTHYF